MPRIRMLLPALTAIAAILLAGCGSDGSDAADTLAGSTTTTSAGDSSTQAFTCDASGEITVSAAASLTQSFTTIGDAFQAACADSEVTFTFDSSGKLSAQILSGAPVDVFASADEANVEKVEDEQTGVPEVFARNQLAIVTKPGNPEGIESLADLAEVDGVVALCAEDAPCGTFAAEALAGANATVDESSVTRGENAKATLAAVSEGDAIAGIVYVTDAAGAGDAVDTVQIPDAENVIATYPAVTIGGTGDADLAAAFVSYLLSDEAQAVLAQAGFLPPA